MSDGIALGPLAARFGAALHVASISTGCGGFASTRLRGFPQWYRLLKAVHGHGQYGEKLFQPKRPVIEVLTQEIQPTVFARHLRFIWPALFYELAAPRPLGRKSSSCQRVLHFVALTKQQVVLEGDPESG